MNSEGWRRWRAFLAEGIVCAKKKLKVRGTAAQYVTDKTWWGEKEMRGKGRLSRILAISLDSLWGIQD